MTICRSFQIQHSCIPRILSSPHGAEIAARRIEVMEISKHSKGLTFNQHWADSEYHRSSTPNSDQANKEPLATTMKHFLDQGKSEDVRKSTTRVKTTDIEDSSDDANQMKSGSVEKMKTGKSQREEVVSVTGKSTRIAEGQRDSAPAKCFEASEVARSSTVARPLVVDDQRRQFCDIVKECLHRQV